MKAKLSLIALVVALAGCQNGTDFNFLEIGKTTPVELEQNLGDADHVFHADGVVFYIYEYELHQKAYGFKDGKLFSLENINYENGKYESKPFAY